ncbi:UDP-N-acetylglucosamine 2-epimerase (non-hydrolysing) [Rhodocyclaceae bacterium]|nr:UDP-N-acetylglucosamine 2-epimerase (non-hydrolysing) [Rhodocyclaceae bacterium]
MNAPRKICVVTGSRAEYGLLRWLLEEIRGDAGLELQLAVTGMHLVPEFGMTVGEIEADGFPIAARVEMLLSSDTPTGIAKSVALGVAGFADAFARLRPDIVVVLGDRFEIFAAAQAAMLARLPIAHIHGGELTEGAVDDAMRHAITKMSHLHFVAAEPYRHRVLQMGEAPGQVLCFGAPGLDAVLKSPRIDRPVLARELGIPLAAATFLVTLHPATLGQTDDEAVLEALLDALAHFPEAHVVFTHANADRKGRAINARIATYARSRGTGASVFASLGPRYLSLLACVDAVIGNSSSGLTEAPLLGVPTVNIGPRQDGRLRSPSVIDCAEDAKSIRRAIEKALSPAHKEIAAQRICAYGHGNSSARIKETLKSHPLEGLTIKRFHDLS